MPKTLAEEIYEEHRKTGPADPPWDQLREDEQQRWIKIADWTYQRVMARFGIPPLKNGMPRVSWHEGDPQPLCVLISEDAPMCVMGTDSGLDLRAELIPMSESHPTAIISAVRVSEAPRISWEAANNNDLPPIPGASKR